MMKKSNLVLIGLLAVHLFFLANLRFTAWPETFSFPYLVNNKYLIYSDFHHPYQPLLTLVLSVVYKLFGYKLIVLKVFTWSLILVGDILIFLISRKLFSRKLMAFLPLAVFVFLQPVFEGNMLWFDLALLPPLLFSVYLVISWAENKKWAYLFAAGLFLSICLLIKQQSILLVVAFLFFLKTKKASLKEIFTFLVGGALPVFLVVGWLGFMGVFKDYLFWTLYFPLYWLPKIPGYAILPTPEQWLSLFLLTSPLLIGIFRRSRKDRLGLIKFFSLLFFASLIAAFPRFSFLHLQPALGAYVILVGLLLATKRIDSMLLIGPVLFVGLAFWIKILPQASQPTRFYEQKEVNLAQFIKENTKPSDKVYLLGPHSLHYVLSDRLPPKPWIENYVWHFEIDRMQEKTIQGWEQDMPSAVLWSTPELGNWYDLGTYQPKEITQWIEANYARVKETQTGTWLWKRQFE